MPTELETALKMRSPIDSRKRGRVFNHFTSNNVLEINWTAVGTGAGVQLAGGAQGRPGIFRGQTGTATTGYVNGRCMQTGGIVLGGGTLWQFQTAVRIPTLPTSTENFFVSLGFGNSITGALSGDGTYFYIDSGNLNWVAQNSNSSVKSSIISTIPCVANTWYDLKVLVNSSANSVEYSINDAVIGSITNNVPNNKAVAPILQIAKVTGTTARQADYDYYDCYWEVV